MKRCEECGAPIDDEEVKEAQEIITTADPLCTDCAYGRAYQQQREEDE